MRKIVTGAYDTAHNILVNNRESLERIALGLLDREVLDANELKPLMAGAFAAGSAAPAHAASATRAGRFSRSRGQAARRDPSFGQRRALAKADALLKADSFADANQRVSAKIKTYSKISVGRLRARLLVR